MSHIRFALLLLAALCVALPLSVIFAMNECQLHSSPAAVEECFRNAERGRLIYAGTLATGLILAIGLHIASSRSTPLALIALAIGPWLTVFA